MSKLDLTPPTLKDPITLYGGDTEVLTFSKSDSTTRTRQDLTGVTVLKSEAIALLDS